MENGENLRRSRKELSNLFEDAYDAVEAKYETVADQDRQKRLRDDQAVAVGEEIDRPNDFLFVGKVPTIAGRFPFMERNGIIGLSKFGDTDQFLVHTYNRDFSPSRFDESYLLLRPNHSFWVLNVKYDVSSLIDPEQKVPEEKVKISRFTDMDIVNKTINKQTLEDLIKFVPLWTPVRLDQVKL